MDQIPLLHEGLQEEGESQLFEEYGKLDNSLLDSL
jgi:hypothetical protein